MGAIGSDGDMRERARLKSSANRRLRLGTPHTRAISASPISADRYVTRRSRSGTICSWPGRARERQYRADARTSSGWTAKKPRHTRQNI